MKETLKNTHPEDLRKIEEDLKREIYYEGSLLDIPNSTYILNLFNRYFFATGSFPTECNLVYIPEGFTPPFIKLDDKISPAILYESFQSSDTYGLASVQFLAALNIFIGGQKYPSRYAMTELFHSLTLQALDVENKKVDTNFEGIIKLCDSIKEKLRSNKALTADKKPYTFSECSPPLFKVVKDRKQEFEEDVVRNKLSGVRVPYPKDTSYMTFPNTPQEIEKDSREREESRKRVSEIMNTYSKIITEFDARKEFLSEVAKIENADIAIDTISNLTVVGSSTPQTCADRAVEEGNIKILSRLDTPRTIGAEKKEQKTEVSSMTDILIN